MKEERGTVGSPRVPVDTKTKKNLADRSQGPPGKTSGTHNLVNSFTILDVVPPQGWGVGEPAIITLSGDVSLSCDFFSVYFDLCDVAPLTIRDPC